MSCALPDPARHRDHLVSVLRLRRPRQTVPGVRRNSRAHHGLHQVRRGRVVAGAWSERNMIMNRRIYLVVDS